VSASGQVIDTTPFSVSSAVGWQDSVDLAWDGTQYLAVWEDSRNGTNAGYPSTYDIYATRVSTAGVALDPAGILVCNAPNWQYLPKAASSRSETLVAWADARNAAPSWFDLYGARIARDGTVLDPDGRALTATTGSSMLPALGWDGTEYLLVWPDVRSATISTELRGTYLSTGARELTPGGFIISANLSGADQPAIAAAGGSALVAYQTGASPQIVARTITAALGLGAGCGGDGSCASGHCVGGVCCDSACSALEACTIGVCTTGTCEQQIRAASCLIAGACIAAGAPDPSNVCGACNPMSSQTAFSSAAEGTTCSTGNACLMGQTCHAGVCGAATSTTTCRPLDECHIAGACDPGTGACSNPLQQNGTPCTGGTCMAGLCVGAEMDAGAGSDLGPISSDSGSAPRDAAAIADAASAVDATGGTASSGGCSCNTSDSTEPSGALLLLIAAILAARVRSWRFAGAVQRRSTARGRSRRARPDRGSRAL
jgi:hypothetical protein